MWPNPQETEKSLMENLENGRTSKNAIKMLLKERRCMLWAG